MGNWRLPFSKNTKCLTYKEHYYVYYSYVYISVCKSFQRKTSFPIVYLDWAQNFCIHLTFSLLIVLLSGCADLFCGNRRNYHLLEINVFKYLEICNRCCHFGFDWIRLRTLPTYNIIKIHHKKIWLHWFGICTIIT